MKDPLSPDLLSALCHELRGPLGAISNWVHVAGSEGATSDMRSRALRGIVGDVHSMSHLIDRLQAVALALRGDEGTIGPVDIVAFLRELLPGRDLRIESPEKLVFVLADPIRLKEMLLPFLESYGKGPSISPATISVVVAGGVAEISLLAPSPRSFALAVARAAALSQGGECVQQGTGSQATVHFRLRRST